MTAYKACALTPAQAVHLINREKAVVIDVCEAEEFAAGHVGGAKNVPLSQLEERLPGVAKNKAVPVVLVLSKNCRMPLLMPSPMPMAFTDTWSLPLNRPPPLSRLLATSSASLMSW